MATSRSAAGKAAATVHPYAFRLAETLQQRSSQRMSLKFRTLLTGFGYYRRTEAIISEASFKRAALAQTSPWTCPGVLTIA
jgi:hypothetical protein